MPEPEQSFDEHKFKIGDLVQLRSLPPIGGYTVVQRVLTQGLTGGVFRSYVVGSERGLEQRAEIELQPSEAAFAVARWQVGVDKT